MSTSVRGANFYKYEIPRSQALAPQMPRKGEETHTNIHKVKAHFEEDRTGFRLTYAENEGVERSKERRNGGWVIGGRGKMERSVVGGEGRRMM